MSEYVMLPLLACDVVLFHALRLARGNPKLFDEIGALLNGEGTPDETRAVFRHLFVPTTDRDNRIVFRLAEKWTQEECA